MNPQNIIVIGCLLTSLLAYLLVLWSGSRIGHGVVIAAVSCLGFVAVEREPKANAVQVKADNPTEIALAAIRRQMEINRGQ